MFLTQLCDTFFCKIDLHVQDGRQARRTKEARRVLGQQCTLDGVKHVGLVQTCTQSLLGRRMVRLV